MKQKIFLKKRGKIMSEQFTLAKLEQHCSDLYKKGTFRWHLEYLKNAGIKKKMVVVEIKETSFNDKNEFHKPNPKIGDKYENTTILVLSSKCCVPLSISNVFGRIAICNGHRYKDMSIDKKLVKFDNTNYEYVHLEGRYGSFYNHAYFKINPKNVYYIDQDGNIEQIDWSIDIINEKLELNLKSEVIKMENKNKETVAVAEATTIGETVTNEVVNDLACVEIPTPTVATEETLIEKINETIEAKHEAEAYADTENVETEVPTIDLTSSYPTPPTAGVQITNVADFLKFAKEKSKPQGISDGRIKVSLEEVISRMDGVVKPQKVEKVDKEGRNFYVVQLDEHTYMYSFKMMTTVINKWVDACGSIENLNNMLKQAEGQIAFLCSKAEYMGKTYTRCDVI